MERIQLWTTKHLMDEYLVWFFDPIVWTPQTTAGFSIFDSGSFYFLSDFQHRVSNETRWPCDGCIEFAFQGPQKPATLSRFTTMHGLVLSPEVHFTIEWLKLQYLMLDLNQNIFYISVLCCSECGLMYQAFTI